MVRPVKYADRKVTTCNIDRDQYARLKKVAEREHRTPTGQLRLIVDDFLEKYEIYQRERLLS